MSLTPRCLVVLLFSRIALSYHTCVPGSHVLVIFFCLLSLFCFFLLNYLCVHLFFPFKGRPAVVAAERVRANWARCTHATHGRSRATINLGIPTKAGRSTSGFHRPGRHCLHRARSAVRCSASRMKGERHPIKKRL